MTFCVFVLMIPIVVLVPTVFNPPTILYGLADAFFYSKFFVLMQFSTALLVAVLGLLLAGEKDYTVPLLVPALAFLGVSTTSALFSGRLLHTFIGAYNRYDGVLSLAAGVLLFYATARSLDSWARVRIFLVAGVSTAIIVSVYGVMQNFGLDPVSGWDLPWFSGDRAASTVGYYLPLAAYLTLMMGATLVLYFRTEGRWERGLWLLALGLMGACWLYTYTRGGVLGVGLALPIVLYLAHRRLGSVRPLLPPLAAVAAALCLAYLLSPQSMNVINRFGDANVARSLETLPEGADVSVTTRLLMWRDTVPVILERPLLGHGPDNFAEPFKEHEGEDLRAFFPNGEVIDKAHNEFLQVAATTGLLGLAAYLWLFVSYFRKAYRSGGWELLALSGGVLAYILQLQTAFTTIVPGVIFWAMLGLSVAIMRLRNAEEDLGRDGKVNDSETARVSAGAAAGDHDRNGAGQDNEV